MVGFARADADNLLNGVNKDFAVANFARAGGFYDGFYRAFPPFLRAISVPASLWQKINGVFCAAIDFGVPFLSPEAFDFGYGHAGDADFGERFAHVVELKGFDDGFNFFSWGILGVKGFWFC